MDRTREALVALSKWIDAGNKGRDPEAITWGRIAKIAEENGEVIEAFIGATGQNPRKGVTHSIDDVLEELLDVAVTALGAYEHLAKHRGYALAALDEKIVKVALRAGAIMPSGTCSCPDPSLWTLSLGSSTAGIDDRCPQHAHLLAEAVS